MIEKKKFHYAQAMAVALTLVELLRSACERIEIAGSLRRGKPMVGDIEIVFVPKMVEVKDGLFDTKLDDAAADRIEALLQWGHIAKRTNKNGAYTWGAQNKLASDAKTGIPIDFFSTTERNWWVTLVIRTGPTESNINLIQQAALHGLKLHAYGVFTDRLGESIIPKSERHVFELAGVSYREPQSRR